MSLKFKTSFTQVLLHNFLSLELLLLGSLLRKRIPCFYYYYCKCVILFSITSIFIFIFIILLVATATLDGLPPYRTVLNCFHLLWLYKLYPYLAGFAAYLVGSIALHLRLLLLALLSTYIIITVLPLPMLCPFPLLWYIYIFINIKNSGKPEMVHWYWLVSKIYSTVGQTGTASGTILTLLLQTLSYIC